MKIWSRRIELNFFKYFRSYFGQCTGKTPYFISEISLPLTTCRSFKIYNKVSSVLNHFIKLYKSKTIHSFRMVSYQNWPVCTEWELNRTERIESKRQNPPSFENQYRTLVDVESSVPSQFDKFFFQLYFSAGLFDNFWQLSC